MGFIDLVMDGISIRRPLAAVTMLGRHASCTWPLADPRMPLFWVELRWWSAGWCWRQLGGEVRGVPRHAACIPPDWFLLHAGDHLTGAGVRLTLVDDTAPAPFAVDVAGGACIQEPELDKLVLMESDGPWPLGWERAPESRGPLEDGSIFTANGCAYRYHAGSPPPRTRGGLLDLGRRTCRLDLDLDERGPSLRAWDGPAEVVLRGAFLWALLPYMEARVEDVPFGGWLELEHAYSRWREVVEGAASAPDRIGQDRSRSARALEQAGVAGARDLFERRRVRRAWEVRIAPEAERLEVLAG